MTMTAMEALEQRLIDFRHLLHQHPELSNQEVETTQRIRAFLQSYQIRVLDLPLPTGLVAEIGEATEGPVIALRADIDALPIVEKSGVAFASQNPGVMHACGHDVHTAIMLGAAVLLKQQEERLRGRIRMIFQPAEEVGEGALAVLNAGALDGVEAIFGSHNEPSMPVGVLGTRSGVLTAGVDNFSIRIAGRGVHAARPHEGNDPIIVAAQLVLALQSIVSRNLPPSESAVISVTQIQSGTAFNIIPEEVILNGTVRTLSKETRALIPRRMEEIVRGISAAFGVTAEIEWGLRIPSVDNDPTWTSVAMEVASSAGYVTEIMSPRTGGEDFACYQEKIPGAFVSIGSGGPYTLHDPRFVADDRMIMQASRYFEKLALTALERLA